MNSRELQLDYYPDFLTFYWIIMIKVSKCVFESLDYNRPILILLDIS